MNASAGGEKVNRETALHIAAWYGIYDAKNLLIQNGADVNAVNHLETLYHALWYATMQLLCKC